MKTKLALVIGLVVAIMACIAYLADWNSDKEGK